MECESDACVIPIEFPDKLKNFVNRALGKGIVDEMPDEKFHDSSLLLFARCAFRGVALTRGRSTGACLTVLRLCPPDNKHSPKERIAVDRNAASLAFASSTPTTKSLVIARNMRTNFTHHLRKGFMGSIAPE